MEGVVHTLKINAFAWCILLRHSASAFKPASPIQLQSTCRQLDGKFAYFEIAESHASQAHRNVNSSAAA
eukprot:1542388-Pleurochrysis_carterae.AAC.3